MAFLLVAAGCDSEEDGGEGAGRQAVREQGIQPVGPGRADDTPSSTAPRVEPATCPAGAGNCRSASGVVLYVERVDPDGDGDAHYVVAGGSVTAPGLSVIDVARDLRPRRLPHRGELVSAAGPVYTGSHGQHQIEAVEVNHQRRG